MFTARTIILMIVVGLLIFTGRPVGASTTCGWSPVGGGIPDPGQYSLAVVDVVTFDDGLGGGPTLYACGNFTTIGPVTVNYIAKWHSTSWSAVGGGMNEVVSKLFVFDDDGPGPHRPALYATGLFTMAGNVPARSIAKWNGTAWSALGAGVPQGPLDMTAFDPDGDGPANAVLAVGGNSHFVGTWNGSTWTDMSANLVNTVFSLAAFDDDGPGPHPNELYAGGYGILSGGNHLARWNGSAWTPITPGVNDLVSRLCVFDEDGAGPNPARLFAGGSFTTAGGAPARNVARWDGAHWTGLAHPFLYAGLGGVLTDPETLQPTLFGYLKDSSFGDEPPTYLCKWNGTTFFPMGDAIEGLSYAYLYALASYDDDGPGPHRPSIIAGGRFSTAGGLESNNIARWTCTGLVSQTVNVPPVNIMTLAHSHTVDPVELVTTTVDSVAFPCVSGSCNGPGYSAAIHQNDAVVIRFQAPTGKKFQVIKAPGANQNFYFNAYWQTSHGDTISNTETPAITFENLVGQTPQSNYNHHGVSNAGQAIVSSAIFPVTGDFSFTTVNVQFTVGHALLDLVRTYSPVNSYSTSSFGCYRATSGVTDTVLMRIFPICAGDVNGNGFVNIDDMLAVINSWGQCAGCAADRNGDGYVNIDDLLVVLNGWGSCQ